MSAVIMDGKALAKKVKEEVRAAAARMERRPGLAVILVGDDPASQVYADGKKRDCAQCGIYSEEYILPAETGQEELMLLIETLNGRSDIDGILIQLPLPAHLNERAVLSVVRPDKDVDCFHPFNVGELMIGEKGFYPCTPASVMRLLAEYGVELSGKSCCTATRSRRSSSISRAGNNPSAGRFQPLLRASRRTHVPPYSRKSRRRKAFPPEGFAAPSRPAGAAFTEALCPPIHPKP